MSKLYGQEHRHLQERFDSRRLADRLEEITVHDKVPNAYRSFIESRDMFFLASVDQQGRPTVSYKGGERGFVQVLDEATIVFPSYNGNGMYLSLGNIAGNSQVGMLFIDFETPQRLRVQGTAVLDDSESLVSRYPGAELVVRVSVSQVFPNCPRYIHRYEKKETSRYVPREGEEAPFPCWKRVEDVHDSLPGRDRGKVEDAGGPLTRKEYYDKLKKGQA